LLDGGANPLAVASGKLLPLDIAVELFEGDHPIITMLKDRIAKRKL